MEMLYRPRRLRRTKVIRDLVSAEADQQGLHLLGDGLLGDKAHSMIFDNSKIKRLVPDYAATIPFVHGVEEILAWHDADPSRQVIDDEKDRLMDKIIAAYESAYPQAT